MKPVVYISGPIGPVDGPNREFNIARAHGWAEALVGLGFAPILPHLYTYLLPGQDVGYEEWMDVDFALINASSALLRIEGESPGGDREVEFANRHQVPVFFGLGELNEWKMERFGK